MLRTKSSKKKLRKDRRKSKLNLIYKIRYSEAVSHLRKLKNRGEKVNQQEIKKAYSAIDKASRRGIIHKNKAARLKAAIARKHS